MAGDRPDRLDRSATPKTMIDRHNLLALVAFLTRDAAAQAAPQPSPHAIDIPPWFSDTFLDFREDIADAAPTAGLQQTSPISAGDQWQGTRLVAPRAKR